MYKTNCLNLGKDHDMILKILYGMCHPISQFINDEQYNSLISKISDEERNPRALDVLGSVVEAGKIKAYYDRILIVTKKIRDILIEKKMSFIIRTSDKSESRYIKTAYFEIRISDHDNGYNKQLIKQKDMLYFDIDVKTINVNELYKEPIIRSIENHIKSFPGRKVEYRSGNYILYSEPFKENDTDIKLYHVWDTISNRVLSQYIKTTDKYEYWCKLEELEEEYSSMFLINEKRST